jgi:hypothetical protein
MLLALMVQLAHGQCAAGTYGTYSLLASGKDSPGNDTCTQPVTDVQACANVCYTCYSCVGFVYETSNNQCRPKTALGTQTGSPNKRDAYNVLCVSCPPGQTSAGGSSPCIPDATSAALLSFSSSVTCGYSGCTCTNPFSSWTGTNYCSGWTGVTCTSEVVTSISLSSQCLQGTIPVQWSVLTGLTSLNFPSNLLSGTLPTQWSAVSDLASLSLASNAVVGTLPVTWGSLTDLSSLSLQTNALTGTFPQQWSLMTSIISLTLTSNQVCTWPLYVLGPYIH